MATGFHVELRGISKRFHAVEALADIDLQIERGKIHGLVGENGAGKSTLGKIVSGVIRSDTGEILVDGQPVQFASPRDALDHRITMISQELSLVPQRSVIDNVFLGIENTKGWRIRQRDLRQQFDELNARSDFDLSADTIVSRMRIGDQKKVEIMRAVARDARLIVMDEPTASMSAAEAEVFLRLVRDLRDGGTTVIYISHFLKEVLALVDTVTVLRNGQLIRTAPSSEETPATLVTAMLGRDMSLEFPPKAPPPPNSPIVLLVDGLSVGTAVKNASLIVRAGEIVGLAGLVGSGRSEIARAIYGADRRDAGEIRVERRLVDIRSPQTAIEAGIAMLPESRKLQGLMMRLSVGHNVTLPHLDSVSWGPIIRLQQELHETRSLLEELDVRPPEPRAGLNSLSGGNQQKVLFAKWLFRRPHVLIADEPTSGVDVGAKRAIYRLLTSLAEHGMAVLLISSELEEVLGLAHRVYVMRLGKIVNELEGAALTEEAVMHGVFATEQVNGQPV